MALDPGFWGNEAKRLFNLLFPQILKSATKGAQNAMAQVLARTEVGVDWGIVNDAVYDWAQRYTFDLVKGINQTSEAFLQKSVSQWTASGAPLDDLMQTIEPMFGETRARMISVTEVTRAYAMGNKESWIKSGVVEKKRFMTAEDDRVCPVCAPLDGQEFDLSEDIIPLHVGDRCYWQPVVRLPE